jgi:uncharacterized protein YycO
MRNARNILIIALFALLPAWHAYGEPLDSVVKDGDIIFHTSRSSQSSAIQRATGSRYGHMGIIFIRKGIPVVYEAVQTVRYTPLRRWTARGDGGHFVVKRLRDADRILTAGAIKKLMSVAATFEGKPYDLTFEWSDERIYCSELVWKIYERALGVKIGALQQLRDFNLDDPTVRRKMKERYGNAIPMNETVIAPSVMFDASNLAVVLQQ